MYDATLFRSIYPARPLSPLVTRRSMNKSTMQCWNIPVCTRELRFTCASFRVNTVKESEWCVADEVPVVRNGVLTDELRCDAGPVPSNGPASVVWNGVLLMECVAMPDET